MARRHSRDDPAARRPRKVDPLTVGVPVTSPDLPADSRCARRLHALSSYTRRPTPSVALPATHRPPPHPARTSRHLLPPRSSGTDPAAPSSPAPPRKTPPCGTPSSTPGSNGPATRTSGTCRGPCTNTPALPGSPNYGRNSPRTADASPPPATPTRRPRTRLSATRMPTAPRTRPGPRTAERTMLCVRRARQPVLAPLDHQRAAGSSSSMNRLWVRCLTSPTCRVGTIRYSLGSSKRRDNATDVASEDRRAEPVGPSNDLSAHPSQLDCLLIRRPHHPGRYQMFLVDEVGVPELDLVPTAANQPVSVDTHASSRPTTCTWSWASTVTLGRLKCGGRPYSAPRSMMTCWGGVTALITPVEPGVPNQLVG